jgi:energy-coupling factor transport system ATP-binding protein
MGYHVRHITYRYAPDLPDVLKDVDFEIEPGKVTAVVGPSGCGKSTLVEILSGVIPALVSKGVLRGAFDAPDGTLTSVVSQTPENQLFGYGVEDAIAFGLENMGVASDEIASRVEYVLDLLNLQHLRLRSVANLSGGQRQSVCIASVLAMNPDVLVMDEPVSSLDPGGKRMVQDILRQLAKNGNTVLLVDNNLVWSADIVDHVVGLRDGVKVFDGTRDDFFRDRCAAHDLGVVVPQEVEVYHALAEKLPGLPLFHDLAGAQSALAARLPRASADAAPPPAPAAASAPAVVTAHQLTKVFDDGFRALSDVNASVPEGRILAILGQNGSGKTTFVKHLNGLLKPTSGDVRYRGESTLGRSVAQISRNVILVFQHPEHMLFADTVEEEITFCARMHGTEFPLDRLTDVLRRYGLDADRETFPLNLSMGKKHMLTILSVLFSRADVIVLDEPTLGMDALLVAQLEELMAALKASGKTVVVISHEIPLVFRVADAAIVLSRGEKVFEGSKEELARRDDLFARIRIDLPPVVRLSRALGLPRVAFTVADFAAAFLKEAR